MTTEYILNNLRAARAVLVTVPSKELNLEFFKQETHCGTIACAAGWLAMHPTFEPIMKLIETSPQSCVFVLSPDNTVPKYKPNNGGYDFGWLDKHFGPEAFDRLFATKGEGLFDSDHRSACFNEDDDEFELEVTDKELVLWRFDQQIDKLTKRQTQPHER